MEIALCRRVGRLAFLLFFFWLVGLETTANYPVYVPIEIKTCMGCSDKVVDTPPNRVSPDGKSGFIQIIAMQQPNGNIQMHWSSDGFKILQGSCPTQPAKIIEVPCVCCSSKQAVPQAAMSLIAKPTSNISLQEMVQWYRGKVVLCVAPGGNTTARTVIQLLPPEKSDADAPSKQLQNELHSLLAEVEADKPHQPILPGPLPIPTTKPDLPTISPETSSQQPLVVAATPPKVDLRPIYVPELQLKNLRHLLSPQEQLTFLREHQPSTQSWSGLREISVPNVSYVDHPSLLPSRMVVSVDGHRIETGPGGPGGYVEFNMSQERAAERQLEHARRQQFFQHYAQWAEMALRSDIFSPDYFLRLVAAQKQSSAPLRVEDLFSRHDLYEHDAFIILLQRQSAYSEQILSLREQINKDKKKFNRHPDYRRYHIWEPGKQHPRYVRFPELINHLADEIATKQELARQQAQALLNQELERQLQQQIEAQTTAAAARHGAAIKKQQTQLAHELKDLIQQEQIRDAASQPAPVFSDEYRTADFERYGKQKPLKLDEAMFDDTLEQFEQRAQAEPTNSWAEEDAVAVGNMVNQFQEALETDDQQAAQRWARRLEAIQPGAHNERGGYQGYSNEYKKFLADNGFDPVKQANAGYYQPEAQVRYESNEILQKTFASAQQYGHLYDVKHLNKCTMWAVKAANDQALERVARALSAFHLLEVAHALQTAADKVGQYLSSTKDVALRSAAVIEHITKRTVQLLGKRAKEIIANPLPYAGELALAAALPQVALARLLYNTYADREQLKTFFTHAYDLVKQNPAQAAAHLATFGIEFALTGKLQKNINQLSKHAQEFVRLWREEQRVLQAAAAGGIETPLALTPLSKAVEGVGETIKQTGGLSKYETLCEEVYATCKELPIFRKDRLNHLFKRDQEKSGRPGGFHVESSYPGKLIEKRSLPADEHGIYAGFYEHGNWEKFSTFFPKNMNRVEVKRAIEEAFQNPIFKKNFSVIGQTSNGMKIKIVFKKYGTEIRVHSAFPLYKGQEDFSALIKSLGREESVYKK